MDAVPEFKILYMQQIARFGNQKSFLNIRTSKGKMEDADDAKHTRVQVEGSKNDQNGNSDVLKGL